MKNIKRVIVVSETEETKVLKDQCTWSVIIGSDECNHKYNFKASSHLSIAVMFGLFMTILRLAGYKK